MSGIDSNFLQGISGLFSQIQASNLMQVGAQGQANSILAGGEMAAQGRMLTADGFRQSAIAAQGAADFNLSIDRLNFFRQIKAFSRQAQRQLGAQSAQTVAAGIGGTSATALALRNEALDYYDRTLMNAKIDADNTRRAKVFESQVRQVNLENQARASEYAAQVERVSASNQASAALFQGELARYKTSSSLTKAVPTLLSQLGGSEA